MARRQKFRNKRYSTPASRQQFPTHVLCIVLLLVLCLLIGLSRHRSGIDFADEGLLAYGAVRVMHGEVPNRDFVSLQPPLTFYTAAAMFELFGTSLVSLRILGFGIYLAIPLLIYSIARHLTGRALSLAAALPATILGIPYFNFVPYSVWQGITASLAAALLFLHASLGGPGNRRQYYLALPAGLLSAASILFRHDQGLYSAVSILAYIFVLKCASGLGVSKPDTKPLVGFWLSGMALVFLPFGVYWLVARALPEMFKQLVAFPLTTYAQTSSLPLPWFGSGQSFTFNAVVFLFYLPPVIEILATVWLVAKKVHGGFSLREAKLAFMTIWSTLFYCQVLTRSDLSHLLITLAPFFILCVWCWSAALETLGRTVANKTKSLSAPARLRLLASGCAGAFVVCYLLVLRPVFLPPLIETNETLLLERGGVRIKGARDLKEFIEAVQSLARPDQSILCLPYQPMLYFLCKRRNATRWNYLWPGDQTADDHQDLIRQAQSDPPAVIFITGESTMGRYASAILDYVHREYKRRVDSGLVTIYLP